MPPTVTMTIRLPLPVMDRLKKLADATDRSRAYLAEKAIEEYLEVQAWQVEAIREGLEAADRGEFVSHEKVKACFKRMGARVGRR